MELKSLKDLLPYFQENCQRKVMAIAAPEDSHTVLAAVKAWEAGVITPLLFGDPEKIQAAFAEAGVSSEPFVIYPAQTPQEAAKLAIEAIRDGKADYLMKGTVETKDLLKVVVARESGMRTDRIMSKFDFIENPGYHKLIALTDSAMNPKPDLNMKKQIIDNAIDVLHAMGIAQPKIAVLASAETLNPKLQESVDAWELKKLYEAGAFADCYLEGPISIDLAMEPESVRIKNYDSPVGGDADLMVCPDLVSGNLMGKGMLITGAKAAGIIVGAKVPIVLMSRSASVEDKLYSIILGAIAAG